jgi:hypothetical protein
MCYGGRWSVETSFPTFKRLYGNTAWLEAWRT